jgi:hypothetical protein
MKKALSILAAVVLCGICSAAWALYGVNDVGTWPKSWPSELEPLRKQARTLVGPMAPHRHYAIRFTSREQFEAAWPSLLKVKTKGAPIFVVRGENFFLGEKQKAGVVVHCPPEGQNKNPRTPEKPIEGVQEPHMRWMNTYYLEVVDDGEIVDFEHLKVPKRTPIIDERHKERAQR